VNQEQIQELESTIACTVCIILRYCRWNASKAGWLAVIELVSRPIQSAFPGAGEKLNRIWRFGPAPASEPASTGSTVCTVQASTVQFEVAVPGYIITFTLLLAYSLFLPKFEKEGRVLNNSA